ncbi:TPA: glycine zipper family protein, partial [Raoultella planticola]|nr:glycine zipper family protein [Raoultella planticola]
MKTANGMAIFLGCALTFSVSAMDKTAGGAVAGAAVGALSGKNVRSTVQGAVVGGGIGAMTEHGDKGKAARTGGAIGAAV